MNKLQCNVLWFEDIGLEDIPLVGGKNANLGELCCIQNINNIAVPTGFALTTQLYKSFIQQNNLSDYISAQLEAFKEQKQNLINTGTNIRKAILKGNFLDAQVNEVSAAYQALCEKVGVVDCDVAVRSSATAEDLPEASFAGQQESFLNIQGTQRLINSCKSCFASLYTDRAITYRQLKNINENSIALSVGVQQMVRSDKAGAGVIFTLDTESGFPDVVLINAGLGLGESVVKGSITPDRYMVYKPLLWNKCLSPIIEKSCGSKLQKIIYQSNDKQADLASTGPSVATDFTLTVNTSLKEQQSLVLQDDEILQLANWAVVIENYYGYPMDIEWAKDGETGNLYIVQARPETIESRKDRNLLKTYQLNGKSALLLRGASVGSAIVSGKVMCLGAPSEGDSFPDGAILVAHRTDPDWVPVMKRAAGIITDVGGTTSHAAIVSRELQVPAIVGTGEATQDLKDSMEVTLDCASGSQGKVYLGCLPYESKMIHIDKIPHTKTDIMINIAVPEGALRWWRLPIAGIGLARIEFIISSLISVHPMALVQPENVTDAAISSQIKALTCHYKNATEYFVDKLSMGIAMVAASCYPKPVIVRFSDFKSNEYQKLIGGQYFEINEENPMLGLRGASRYYHPNYRPAFDLECRSIKRVREQMGFDNVIAMIPFCRTVNEADRVLSIMAENGLSRGEDKLQIYMMCELPSNIVLAEQFASRFDGFSIGSNDLTQMILGIDRDSAALNYLSDPNNEAVTSMIADVIKKAHKHNIKIGLCGQAPSDYPEFAEFLVACGIDSISLNPDSVVSIIEHVARAEIRH